MNDVDEAQESNETTGAETSTDASTSGGEEANQDSQDVEQSTDSNNQSADGTYVVGDRTLSADEVYKEYQNLQRDYTKKSQKLSEYEKSIEKDKRELGTGAESVEAARGMSRDIAKEVPQDVREAVVAIMEPEIEKRLDDRFQQFTQTQRQTEEIKRSFERLEQKWDGSDGKPKFDSQDDKQSIINYMQKEGKVFDPEIAYEQLHKDEINDWRVKQALRKSSGGRKTEKTGGGEQKPKRKTPKTLSEASEATLERLRNAI